MKIFKKNKSYFFSLQVNTQITQGVLNEVYTFEEDLSMDEFLKEYLIKNADKLTVKAKDKNNPFNSKEFPVMNIAILFFTEVQNDESNT